MAFTFKHGDRPLEGFEIQRGVGRGGFGEVYYAISDGGREVALKYLREHPEVELRGIAQCINLKSPHLVSIFDVRQSKSGEYFVIMEYVGGPSLRDMLIAEPGGLGVQKAAFFIREIAKGLAYLHDRGIVHRDLKPGNIFYDEGYVKICDYGLSKFISVSRHSAQTASIGTVHYMAPEVGSGNYSKTIDIYALGVILYEMLLGRVPYEGSSMGEILMKHLTQQPEVDRLPQPFASVIRRAMAKDPADRFQNVSEMVDSIFEVEDVRNSVVGLEPASLTMVAGRAAADLRPSPVPSDNPATPRARVRGPAHRQSAEEFSKRFVERTTGLDPRTTKKERRVARKETHRRRKEPAPQLLGQDHTENLVRSRYHIGFGRRLARLFAAAMVAGGLAFGIGVISRNAELGAASFAVIMTATVGIGLGTKIASWLGPDHPALIRRLLILACAAPTAGIVYGAIADDRLGRECFGACESLQMLYLPFLVAFGLFDWRDDIRRGARGDFSIWGVLWLGFLCFVGTEILFEGFLHEDISEATSGWVAGILASIALSLQSFSWAMIRNPLPGFVQEASVHPDLAPPRDVHRPATPAYREPVVAAVPAAPISGARPDAPSGFVSRAIPAQHRRSAGLRLVSGVLAALCGMAMLALSILLGAGEFSSHEEAMGAIVGIVSASLAMLFWLGTTTSTKRVGMWNEWINPLSRIAAGTGIAVGITGLVYLNSGDFIVLIVLSSLFLLFLLICRRSKGSQLEKAFAARAGTVDSDDRDDSSGWHGAGDYPGGNPTSSEAPSGGVSLQAVQNDFVLPLAQGRPGDRPG